MADASADVSEDQGHALDFPSSCNLLYTQSLISFLHIFVCASVLLFTISSILSLCPAGPDTEWSILYRTGLLSNLNLVEVRLRMILYVSADFAVRALCC